MNFSSVDIPRSFITQLPNTTENLNLDIRRYMPKRPIQPLIDAESAFNYILGTVAKQLNLDPQLIEVAQRVKEFCLSYNFTITNFDIFKPFPAPHANPSAAMDLFVIRLIRKIYYKHILPETNKVISLLERLWEPSKSIVKVTNFGGGTICSVSKDISLQDFQSDCEVWENNFIEGDLKRLRNYFEIIKGWYLPQLFESLSLSKAKSKVLDSLMTELTNAESEMTIIFLHIPVIVKKC